MTNLSAQAQPKPALPLIHAAPGERTSPRFAEAFARKLK